MVPDIESILYLDFEQMLKLLLNITKMINDQTLILRLVNVVFFSGLIFIRHFVAIFGVRYNHPVWVAVVRDLVVPAV